LCNNRLECNTVSNVTARSLPVGNGPENPAQNLYLASSFADPCTRDCSRATGRFEANPISFCLARNVRSSWYIYKASPRSVDRVLNPLQASLIASARVGFIATALLPQGTHVLLERMCVLFTKEGSSSAAALPTPLSVRQSPENSVRTALVFTKLPDTHGAPCACCARDPRPGA